MAAGRPTPLLLQKISLSPFQRTRKHFSSERGRLWSWQRILAIFQAVCRSDGWMKGWNNSDAVCKCRAGDSPLLKTRNEIQLTNCFLRVTSDGRTKFAFGARNSVRLTREPKRTHGERDRGRRKKVALCAPSSRNGNRRVSRFVESDCAMGFGLINLGGRRRRG